MINMKKKTLMDGVRHVAKKRGQKVILLEKNDKAKFPYEIYKIS